MIKQLIQLIDGYIFLYRLCDGPKDFIMSCFINRLIVPFKYGLCSCCASTVTKKPWYVGLWIRITRKPWLCGRCSCALAHTHSCHRRHCMLCEMYNDHLREADVKATAERLLKDVGLSTVVYGPED